MQDDPIGRPEEFEPLVYELDEFCKTHRLGKTTFYQLLHEGDGPDVFWLGRSPRITREAARDWRERMRARGRVQVTQRVPRPNTDEK
jgi:hypothetical protein